MRSGSDDRPVTEDTEAEEGTEGWIGAPALVLFVVFCRPEWPSRAGS